MAGLDFGSFLERMDEQTGQKHELPSLSRIKENKDREAREKALMEESLAIARTKPPRTGDAAVPVQPKAVPPKKRAPRAVDQSEAESPEAEEESFERPETPRLDEEDVERVLETTSIVMKTIRTSFPDKAVRRVVYESIVNAISMALGDAPQHQQYEASMFGTAGTGGSRHSPPPGSTLTSPVSGGFSGYMSEEEFNAMPTVTEESTVLPRAGGKVPLRMNPSLVGKTVSATPPVPVNEGAYSRELHIRPGQGLSGVAASDIQDMRVLAGIAPAPQGAPLVPAPRKR